MYANKIMNGPIREEDVFSKIPAHRIQTLEMVVYAFATKASDGILKVMAVFHAPLTLHQLLKETVSVIVGSNGVLTD